MGFLKKYRKHIGIISQSRYDFPLCQQGTCTIKVIAAFGHFSYVFALALDAQHQSGLPRRGTIKWNHDMTSFMVMDDETSFCPTFPCEREQGRFARSFEGCFWSEAE